MNTMQHTKTGTLIMTKEATVITIYRRVNNEIECYYLYHGGETNCEVYVHANELECFDNWQGLLETLEAETVRMVGAKWQQY